MALLSDLIPQVQTRASMSTTGGAELMLRQNLVNAGVTVTERTAMSFAAVHLAVRIIAETIGLLPVRIYQETEEHRGKRLAKETQADYLLHVKPNPFQTPMQFVEMIVGHTVLRGFGVARKIFNNAGKVTALIPLHPSSVEFGYRKNGEIYFRVNHTIIDEKGLERTVVEILFQSEVFFLMGLSLNHYPVSPIRYHAETIGVALATRDYKGSFFSNSAMPSGILKHPGFFREDQEEEIERIRKEFKEKFTGGNRFSTMVLQHGMEWEQIGISNTDSELVKSEEFNILEIARAFRIQPHKLMHLNDMGRANIEQMAIEHKSDTLLPWGTRFEQAVNRDLLSEKERLAGFGAAFSYDTLLRGDTESRHKAYAHGRQWGYFSINDIRDDLGKPPLDPEIGDVYLSPVNMVNAALAGRDQEQLQEVEGESPLAGRSRELVEAILKPVVRKISARFEKNLSKVSASEEIRAKENQIAGNMIAEVLPAIQLACPGVRSFNLETIFADLDEQKILENLLQEILP